MFAPHTLHKIPLDSAYTELIQLVTILVSFVV